MDVEAELVWSEELMRRQDRHIAEVWRLLNVWPRDVPVHLRYGPNREAVGIIQNLDGDMVELKLREGATRWVPLLQVGAIDGREVETARSLPRPEADGVELRVVEHKP